MKKFRVTIPTCPDGYLRYGHFTGTWSGESAEAVRKEFKDNPDLAYNLSYELTDYETNSTNLDDDAIREMEVEEIADEPEAPAERHPIICYEDVPQEILDHFIPISALDAHLEKFSIADGSTVKVTIAAVKSDWITGTAEQRKALVDNELTRPVLTAEGVHNELGTAVLEGLKSIFDGMRGKS